MAADLIRILQSRQQDGTVRLRAGDTGPIGPEISERNDFPMKNSYGEYSDEEFIVLLRDGENDITDYIMEKYKGMVRQKPNPCIFWAGTATI